MFGSEVLEIVIGLVFIYLTLSLLATAVTESVSNFLAMRSGTLIDSLENLLKEGDTWKEFYKHPLISKLGKGKVEVPERGLRRGKGFPSYITAKTFSTVLFDVVFAKRKINPETNELESDSEYLQAIREFVDGDALKGQPDLQRILKGLLSGVETDLGAFQANVENFYDEIQERASGWYRRRTKLIAFLFGLIVAALANADSIGITNALLRDAALRDAIVETATQTESSQIEEDITTIRRELLETQLLGWDWESTDESNVRARPPDVLGWIMKVLGIVMTAAAISLGAPFWFDVLSKIMTVRSSGKLPGTEEKSAAEDKGKTIKVNLPESKGTAGSDGNGTSIEIKMS